MSFYKNEHLQIRASRLSKPCTKSRPGLCDSFVIKIHVCETHICDTHIHIHVTAKSKNE